MEYPRMEGSKYVPPGYKAIDPHVIPTAATKANRPRRKTFSPAAFLLMRTMESRLTEVLRAWWTISMRSAFRTVTSDRLVYLEAIHMSV